jgi:signal transduction histidine kinase
MDTFCAMTARGIDMRRVSLTWRIIFGVVACQLLLTAGVVAVSLEVARRELFAAFDANLRGRAMSALALVRFTEDKPPKLIFDETRLPPPADPRHRDLYEIKLSSGGLLAASPDWKGPTAEKTRERTRGGVPYLFFEKNETPYRAIVLRDATILDVEEDVPGPPPKVTVTYAATTEEIDRRLTALGFTIGAASIALLGVASLLAAWSVRRDLRPLRDLANLAEAVSVKNWTFQPSLAAQETAELAPLTRAIESVLARLHDAFRQQSDFISDAAHELKTSVAIVKSTLQTLLQKPRPEEEYRRGLARLLEDCERLEDLLARMLRLARVEQWAETGAMRKIGVTELTSTCEAAIARMQSVAAARGVEMELKGGAPISVCADPEDLELVWVNLLENAVRYSSAGSRVRMEIENGDRADARVSVVDSGPGIPPEQLPKVFERFHRGDASRSRETGGFGLGLAICKAITEAYGGSIEASNSPTGGARFVVQLPHATG